LIGTGWQESLTRRDRDVSCLQYAREFVGATWPAAAAKSPVSDQDGAEVIDEILGI
jgi:hypothetical protein